MTAPQTFDVADQIIKLVSAVPATVWAGLIGAGLALTGVVLTNWGTSRRLKLQLTHDADQKQLDRLAALRKDIYLQAGEQVVRAQQHLTSLNAMNEKTNPADGLIDFVAIAAQIGLVASDRTARLVAELNLRFGEAFLALLPEAAPAHRARTSIEYLSEQITAAQAQADAAIESMRHINESGELNQVRFEAPSRSVEFETARIQHLTKQRDSAYERMHAANRSFHSAVTVVMDRLAEQSIAVQISLREEMGLETDPDEARRLMTDARDRMRRAADEANSKIFAPATPEDASVEPA